MSVNFIKYDDNFFENWKNKTDNFARWKHVKSELICGKTGRPIPKITICIPTYKGGARVLKEAVKSVLAQKDFDSYDIIVSDNYAPGDAEIESLMRKFCNKYDNIRYYRTDYDFGVVANWNRTVELAESEWVCQLQHDDVMCPGYLKKVYECAVKYHATLVGVFRNMICESPNTDKRYVRGLSSSQRLLSFLRFRRPFHVRPNDVLRIITPATGCLFYKRSAYMALGGHDPQFEEATDGFFHFNQMYNGNVVILPEFLYKRRIAINLSLKEDIQSKVVSMLYGFGCYFIKSEHSVRNRQIAQLILELSIAHMVWGIKLKYIPDLDVQNLLTSMGIRKSVVAMPNKLLSILNRMLLTDLIIRK